MIEKGTKTKRQQAGEGGAEECVVEGLGLWWWFPPHLWGLEFNWLSTLARSTRSPKDASQISRKPIESHNRLRMKGGVGGVV